MQIVSANYRDRKGPNPWLIRDFGTPPEDARAVSTVHATGVAFCPASDFELGFGCYTVAQCQTAVGGDALPQVQNAVPLKFDGHGGFYVTGRRGGERYVETVAMLILKTDGSMLAVLEGETPRVATTARETVTA